MLTRHARFLRRLNPGLLTLGTLALLLIPIHAYADHCKVEFSSNPVGANAPVW
jgi:hypothetical protein